MPIPLIELNRIYESGGLSLQPELIAEPGSYHYFLELQKEGASGSINTRQSGVIDIKAIDDSAQLSSLNVSLAEGDDCSLVIDIHRDGVEVYSHKFDCRI